MSLNVTPGDTAADSYADVSVCVAYALAKGLTFPGTDATLSEQALRRATSWIDANYRNRFPGYPTDVWQALEWPRTGVFYRGRSSIASNVIPQQILSACCEAAVREFAEPGSLNPDLERGGAIKRLKAGSVEVEYGASATPQTAFQIIDGILSGLLEAPSQYTARAVRG